MINTMSDAEKLQQEALAHRALKDADSKIAVLSASLSEAGRALGRISTLCRDFTNNPALQTRGGTPISEQLRNELSSLPTRENLIEMASALNSEVERSAELRSHIAKF